MKKTLLTAVLILSAITSPVNSEEVFYVVQVGKQTVALQSESLLNEWLKSVPLGTMVKLEKHQKVDSRRSFNQEWKVTYLEFQKE